MAMLNNQRVDMFLAHMTWWLQQQLDCTVANSNDAEEIGAFSQ